MDDLERFEFTVPGYTPETMPLDRLIEYLSQLMVILGQPSDLHLIDIKRSSTKPVMVMPHHAAVKARKRARETWEGGGSQRARQAYQRIRRMVADDGGKPATLSTAREGTILEFPGVDDGADQEINAVRQASSVTGELIRVGGETEFDQILLRDFSGEIISGCFATKDIAKQLARHLHESVRLDGIATWSRDRQGEWQIQRMKVSSWETLEDTKLGDALVELHQLAGGWPTDLTSTVLKMRNEDAA